MSRNRSLVGNFAAAGVLFVMVVAFGLLLRHVESGQPPLNRTIRLVELVPDSTNGGYVAQVVGPDGRAFRVPLVRLIPYPEIKERDIIYLMQSGTDGTYCAYVSLDLRY